MVLTSISFFHIFLSAGADGGDDRFRTLGEMLHCQKSAQGGVGASTKEEKERFALVDNV